MLSTFCPSRAGAINDGIRPLSGSFWFLHLSPFFLLNFSLYLNPASLRSRDFAPLSLNLSLRRLPFLKFVSICVLICFNLWMKNKEQRTKNLSTHRAFIHLQNFIIRHLNLNLNLSLNLNLFPLPCIPTQQMTL